MAKAVEQTSGRAAAWDAIDWKTHEQHVRCIQERIFHATRDKRWGIVKNLQKLLVRSLSAILVAIKRVTQDNKGKYTAGVDGKIYTTAAALGLVLGRESWVHHGGHEGIACFESSGA